MTNPFGSICGRVAPGLCRFSIGGHIAVRTGGGWRAYDPDKKSLINCDHFALDVGDEFFFVMPTNRVAPGDIILSGGKPRCVLSADGATITAINYEDATIETLLPERHVFMGDTYLYGKIVSMLGSGGLKGKKGKNSMMKYMMLSSMMKNKDGSSLLPLMMMGGRMDFMNNFFEEDAEEEA